MSEDVIDLDNVINMIAMLQLNNENCINNVRTGQTQEPNGTHDLPCRMPQTAGDTDNSDDTDEESDVIVVVDTSDALSEYSCYELSDLSSVCGTETQSEVFNIVSDTDTIPEIDPESEIDINGSTGSSNMDKIVSTPTKRKNESLSNRRKTKCLNKTLPELGAAMMSSPIITTRSGRAVRARMDKKFDYSLEQADTDSNDKDDCTDMQDEDDYDVDSNENDDDYDVDSNEDDDDDDENYFENVRTEPMRKHRRISFRSSCCSSNEGSFDARGTSALIYLNLKQPVAFVSNEPTTADVEHDIELKTRLQKFLGLVAPVRRLYNPMADYESESMEESVCTTVSRSSIFATEPTQFNALSQQSKDALDLSGLPSKEQRAQICQKHNEISDLHVRNWDSHSFLSSLNSDTPLAVCHPFAVRYRKRDFGTCKVALAKTLFHMFNHAIFHCGLRMNITWKRTLNTPSTIKHHIKANGERSSYIVLWHQIKHPCVLVNVLLHEMCHAAAFVYHGEAGHGDNCRKWANRAKLIIPELPQIDDCSPSYKYSCLLCHKFSVGVIKFEGEEEQLRCHYCQFEVNVAPFEAHNFYNVALTDQLVTPYRNFVRAKYMKCKQSSHRSKMLAINELYKQINQL